MPNALTNFILSIVNSVKFATPDERLCKQKKDLLELTQEIKKCRDAIQAGEDSLTIIKKFLELTSYYYLRHGEELKDILESYRKRKIYSHDIKRFLHHLQICAGEITEDQQELRNLTPSSKPVRYDSILILLSLKNKSLSNENLCQIRFREHTDKIYHTASLITGGFIIEHANAIIAFHDEVKKCCDEQEARKNEEER